ncbi:hypothetical protein Tco_0054727, partial [Tanacetum coccineum]
MENATVRPNVAGSHDLVATIDGREIVVTESLIRAQLQLDDANGIFDMQIDDIFAGMGAIGYPPALRLEVGINFQVPLPPPLFVYRLGEEIPLTPPMLAIAAAGNDAANENNAAADEAAGSAAEAHPVPHSPPVSPVREPSPERQSASERPPSLSPTPPAQTFGPEPRPAGYVDPDVLEPIIFGPQPRPSDFVDPDLEEPVIFGPPPRPDNYIEPADIDNLVSMEDDTIHGG